MGRHCGWAAIVVVLITVEASNPVPTNAAPVNPLAPAAGLAVARGAGEALTDEGFEERFQVLKVIEQPREQGLSVGAMVIRKVGPGSRTGVLVDSPYLLEVELREGAWVTGDDGNFAATGAGAETVVSVEERGFRDVLRLRGWGETSEACARVARDSQIPSIVLAGEMVALTWGRPSNSQGVHVGRLSEEGRGEVVEVLASLLTNPRTPLYVREYMLEFDHWPATGQGSPAWRTALADLVRQMAPEAGQHYDYENHVLQALAFAFLHGSARVGPYPLPETLRVDLERCRKRVEALKFVWHDDSGRPFDRYWWEFKDRRQIPIPRSVPVEDDRSDPGDGLKGPRSPVTR